MRSKTVDFALNRRMPLYEMDGSIGYTRMSLSADGSATLMRHGGSGGDHVENIHLDTDTGFARFVELIQKSAAHDKADEIKKALYING